LFSDALKKEEVLTSSSFDKSQERTTYELPITLPAGSKADLQITFAGELAGNMAGYYKSSWKDGDVTKNYTLTQFEVGGSDVSTWTLSLI